MTTVLDFGTDFAVSLGRLLSFRYIAGRQSVVANSGQARFTYPAYHPCTLAIRSESGEVITDNNHATKNPRDDPHSRPSKTNPRSQQAAIEQGEGEIKEKTTVTVTVYLLEITEGNKTTARPGFRHVSTNPITQRHRNRTRQTASRSGQVNGGLIQ